jgi:hypothetical protein
MVRQPIPRQEENIRLRYWGTGWYVPGHQSAEWPLVAEDIRFFDGLKSSVLIREDIRYLEEAGWQRVGPKRPPKGSRVILAPTGSAMWYVGRWYRVP